MPNVCVPVRVDSFVLCPPVCESPNSLIAPLTQPNYAFLRYDSSVIQHDILPQHDLHASGDLATNSRIRNLGADDYLDNRIGVYLHWVLPRVYRSGTAAASSATGKQGGRQQQQGYAPVGAQGSTEPDYSSPSFRSAPNRWIVIRRLQPGSWDTKSGIPEVDAWVLESDCLRRIDDLGADYDLEVDVAPFILPSGDVEEQAEVFIGYREPIQTWNEYPVKSPPPNKQKPSRTILSLLNASNPIFADYQPHNANVFSCLDNFRYPNPDKTSPIPWLYLPNAIASYYVFGWHEEGDPDAQNLDPLNFQPTPKPQTYADRLNSCLMALKGQPFAKGTPEDTWSTTTMKDSSSQVVCHGAMYNVVWDLKNPPARVPADTIGASLKNNVAVGTTTLDALLAYAKTQAPPTPPAKPSAQTTGADTPPVTPVELEKDLLKIQKLLLKQEDGVDPQLQAEDILYEANFAKSEGGANWNLSGSSEVKGTPKALTPGANNDLTNLASMNISQRALDLCVREAQSIQYQLFTQWWKYVAEQGTSRSTLTTPTKNMITALMNRLQPLRGVSVTDPSAGRITALNTSIKNTQEAMINPVGQGAQDRFHVQKDPTIVIAGVDSGWPAKFSSDNAAVRLDTQLMDTMTWGAALPAWDGWSELMTLIRDKVPGTITDTAGKLMQEFYNLQYVTGVTPVTKGSAQFPDFHDETGLGNTAGLDSFANTQAWFPLFIEWEVIYYHVPLEVWQLQDRTSESGLVIPRYGTDPKIWLQGPVQDKNGKDTGKTYADDFRRFSGRIMLLPQPGKSLATVVQQILTNTPSDVLKNTYSLDTDDQKRLKDNISSLPFLSAPMSGFIDHITTLVQGTHIKPSRRAPGAIPTFLQEAIDVCNDPNEPTLNIGLTSDQVNFMGSQTNKTPYGDLATFQDTGYCPFKPATHGQFEFTKLNIIDKFGQAVCAINPKPVPAAQQPYLYPCVSDYFTPAKVVHKSSGADPVPDTVKPDVAGACRFVQVPPLINQPARLNTYFVHEDPDNAGLWTRTTEHENPIWGWILINYADNGLQLFLEDGTFYREIRLGPKGANVSPAWLPLHQPPTPVDPANKTQLDKLIIKLSDPTGNYAYLNAMFEMIDGAIANQPAMPSGYSGFMPGLVGKPFALVHYGISLELEVEPLTNQVSMTSSAPADPELPLTNYQFQVKMGDKERAYDGLVGYYLSTVDNGSVDLDLSQIYTFFDDEEVAKETKHPAQAQSTAGDILVTIGEGNYPKLSPYYLPPAPYVAFDPSKDPPPPSQPQTDPTTLSQMHDNKFTVFGAIMDPFTSLHFYTAILPIQTLTLPPWTIGSAMKKMTAFFHMGPLVVVDNISEKLDTTKILDNSYSYDNWGKFMVTDGGGVGGLGIPALNMADWAWLQPFQGEDKQEDGPDYNAFGLRKIDNAPRWVKGPYTAVEGYLQLKKPIVKPDL
ncbi:hypothetical protein ACEPPN_009293 [Leptodophora sp. 'Broadleaf-Isolate-01']